MRHVPGMPMAYARMIEEFQSSVSNFDRLHDMQRRNMMALAESNKLSLDVLQAFARRQAQIMEQTTSMFADAAGEMMHARNPAALAQKQLAVAHDAFRLAQAELKAFVQIAAQAREDARRIWRKDGDAEAVAEPAIAPEPAPVEPTIPPEPVVVAAEEPVVATPSPEDPSPEPESPVSEAAEVSVAPVIEEPKADPKPVVATAARPRRSGARRKAAS